MNLIGDGYDWHGEVGGYKFVYRPMLSIELRAVMEAMKWTRMEGFALLTAQSHIICGIDADKIENLSDEDFESLWLMVTGISGSSQWFNKWESKTAINLDRGIRLMKNHTVLHGRTCSKCREWWYREDGSIEFADGEFLKRPKEPGYEVACDTNIGCPVGHYKNQVGRLSEINTRVFQHHQNCKAIGAFPNDPIVARNARIIQEALSKK